MQTESEISIALWTQHDTYGTMCIYALRLFCFFAGKRFLHLRDSTLTMLFGKQIEAVMV